jgi:serine/threonine protein kinase
MKNLTRPIPTTQSCKALHYIHTLHRVHRDIKSDNLLISETGEIKIGSFPTPPHFRQRGCSCSHSFTPPTADFGYAAQLTQRKQKRNTVVGMEMDLFLRRA